MNMLELAGTILLVILLFHVRFDAHAQTNLAPWHQFEVSQETDVWSMPVYVMGDHCVRGEGSVVTGTMMHAFNADRNGEILFPLQGFSPQLLAWQWQGLDTGTSLDLSWMTEPPHPSCRYVSDGETVLWRGWYFEHPDPSCGIGSYMGVSAWSLTDPEAWTQQIILYCVGATGLVDTWPVYPNTERLGIVLPEVQWGGLIQ